MAGSSTHRQGASTLKSVTRGPDQASIGEDPHLLRARLHRNPLERTPLLPVDGVLRNGRAPPSTGSTSPASASNERPVNSPKQAELAPRRSGIELSMFACYFGLAFADVRDRLRVPGFPALRRRNPALVQSLGNRAVGLTSCAQLADEPLVEGRLVDARRPLGPVIVNCARAGGSHCGCALS